MPIPRTQTSPARLRLALVGLGNQGQEHLAAAGHQIRHFQ